MKNCIKNNDVSAIIRLIDEGENPDRIVKWACYYGKKDIIQAIIKQVSLNGLNQALPAVVKNNHTNLIPLLIRHGATNYNAVLTLAALFGYMDIVHLMISYGATSFNRAMELAASGGHLEIVKLMVEYGATTYNSSILEAARSGHIDILKYLTQHFSLNLKEVDLWNDILEQAATGHSVNHLEVVKYAITNGASNIEASIRMANLFDCFNNLNYLYSLDK